MLLFNEVISAQGWVELALRGRKYTWSNKQSSPLLERLDWFFTSASWTISFPDNSVTSLSMEPSDHVPCVVSINTSIPKSSIFRFENYWMEHEHFLAVVAHGWAVPTYQTDSAKILSAKFKNLRRVLKAWQSQISNLKANIANVKSVLILLGILEEYMDLTVHEWNFRIVLQDKYTSLLHQQQIYWKQRGTLKWVKFGDEGSKFFHAIATIRYRRNLITSLQDANGVSHTEHHTKAAILWEAYKDRLGTFDSPEMLFDLRQLIQ
jgi:hypothetical protein